MSLERYPRCHGAKALCTCCAIGCRVAELLEVGIREGSRILRKPRLVWLDDDLLHRRFGGMLRPAGHLDRPEIASLRRDSGGRIIAGSCRESPGSRREDESFPNCSAAEGAWRACSLSALGRAHRGCRNPGLSPPEWHKTQHKAAHQRANGMWHNLHDKL